MGRHTFLGLLLGTVGVLVAAYLLPPATTTPPTQDHTRRAPAGTALAWEINDADATAQSLFLLEAIETGERVRLTPTCEQAKPTEDTGLLTCTASWPAPWAGRSIRVLHAKRAATGEIVATPSTGAVELPR